MRTAEEWRQMEQEHDRETDRTQAESQRDTDLLRQDIEEAWMLICGHLPIYYSPKLASALKLIEWQLGIK